MDGQAVVEIERPRSASELIGTAFELYGRLPFLFPILAAAVVIPFWLIVLLFTGAGPIDRHASAGVPGLIVTVLDFALVGPLISALHVHAVDDVRQGTKPRIGQVARRGLKALPAVSAAVIISFLGATLGLVALIVPGVLLYCRWSLAAQAAALDDGGWTDALERSNQLTRGHYLHILGVLILAAVITAIPGFAPVLAFGHDRTTVASFLVTVAVRILTTSFFALVTALLYFDLRARLAVDWHALDPDTPLPDAPSEIADRPPVEPTGHPLDPDSYSDADRPPGWYVIPETPWKMRHWSGGAAGTWSKKKAKTPKQTLAGWWKISGRRET